jgi:hypothetical protein
MKRGVGFLILWLILAGSLAGPCLPPFPPGGVSWPYYFLPIWIPFGALVYARLPGRSLIAGCYGAVAGFVFALPIFIPSQPAITAVTSVDAVVAAVGLSGLAMSVACFGAFGVGRRLFGRGKPQTPLLIESRTGTAPSQPPTPRD